MSTPIISVEQLSKAYRIGLRDQAPDTLVGALASLVHTPWRNLHRLRRLDTFSEGHNGSHGAEHHHVDHDTLWALHDVSFDVHEGEVLGVIGRNGAGKSTLLKILSRITEPTSGRVVLRGRVSSLLEVGTGFHPELSGRENVYMNGTILGMTKREIDRKFDEIVDFSGVHEFLDTPVKRYSSGMKVRLAFAVAAHLEPEILIIDEVLAVGDAEFQKKCLGKMQNVASAGRTVLFVSHNMAAVGALCTRGILLADGQVRTDGPIADVINHYLQRALSAAAVDLSDPQTDRTGDGPGRFHCLTLTDVDGTPRNSFTYREPIQFHLDFSIPRAQGIIVGVSVRDQLGALVLHLNNTDEHVPLQTQPGEQRISVQLDENVLNNGEYTISLWLSDATNILHDRVADCARFSIASPHEELIRCRAPVRVRSLWNLHPAGAAPWSVSR